MSLSSSGIVGFTITRPGGHWANPGSLYSLSRALGVVGFTCARPGGRWVHPESLCSVVCALGVMQSSWGRLVHFGSMGARRGVCWVHSGSFGALKRALGVIGFIWGRWVHSRAPWGSLRSSGRACPSGRWIHPVLLGSHVRTLGVVGLTRARPSGRCGHLVERSSLERALGFVGFIRGRWVQSRTPWVSLSLFWFVGFIRVGPGGGWVNPCRWGLSHAPCVPLGLSGVVLFTRARIRCHCVHSCAPCVSFGSSGVIGFTHARPGGCGVHSRTP